MPNNKFKKGMRIRLTKMNDLQAPPIGTEGTVEFVDDAGQIHMFWDNGSRLALVPELDEFIVLGRYKVVYYENLAHVFYVDAENKEEAEEIFMRQIENGEYDFSDGEVIETEYEIKEEEHDLRSNEEFYCAYGTTTCPHFYKGYCGKFEDGCFHQCKENKEKMTWETMNEFRSYICVTCKSNDWYCPTDCDFLEKAKRYPIERINKAFMDCEEDVVKLCRRIKSWK